MKENISNEINGEGNSSKKNSLFNFKLKRILKIFFIALTLSVIFKAFLVDAYQIPTGSMKDTLLVGDYIFVNKVAYSFSTPKTLPLIGIKIPWLTIINFSKPKRNDVIVFDHPGFFKNEDPYIHSRLIKRIIGLPGDTVLINNNEVYINNVKLTYPPNAIIDTTNLIEKKFYDKNILSFGNEWNKGNYGPVVVPYKGLKIKLSPKNIKYWKLLIDNELSKKAVREEGTVITIEDKPVETYTIHDNYYFVLGDNRNNSVDSRFWGFVPSNFIIGKAEIIYWSFEPYQKNIGIGSFIKSVRFNRIFNNIN